MFWTFMLTAVLFLTLTGTTGRDQAKRNASGIVVGGGVIAALK